MSVKHVLATTAFVMGSMMLAHGALASSRTPAEIPPTSYTGTQYVDSRGCAFVRAGSGGAVTWVPRMARDRQHMCNARPTVVSGANSSGRTTAASTASNVVQLTIPSGGQTQTRVSPPRVTFRPTVQAPAPSPNFATNSTTTQPRVTTIAPQGNTRTVSITPRRAAVVPAVAPRNFATPAAQPVRTQTASSACAVSGISAQYVNHGQHGPVRCGPQGGVHPADYARGARAVTTTNRSYTSTARSGVPYEPVNANPQVATGYRTAWTDGRLNPNRGPRGGASVSSGERILMWTSYAPYRLIDIATGQDVTAHYPQYAAPNGPSNVATGSYNFAQPTSTNGSYVASMSSRTPTATATTRTTTRAVRSTTQRTRTPVAQIASARTGASHVTVGRGHRYVQLGAYNDANNVNRAIATLHRLGLPAARIRTSRGTQIVVSGPFNDPQTLGRALAQARSSGYGDAITRR